MATKPRKYRDVPTRLFADPGLQPDHHLRYPLDTDRRIANAAARIHERRAAAQYTPTQLRRVEGRIERAERAHGIGQGRHTHTMWCRHATPSQRRNGER